MDTMSLARHTKPDATRAYYDGVARSADRMARLLDGL
jgi:hypothetical protein